MGQDICPLFLCQMIFFCLKSCKWWEYPLKYILVFFNLQECASIIVWNSDFGEDEPRLSQLSFCSFLNIGDSWILGTVFLSLFWNPPLPFLILPGMEGEMAKVHEKGVFPWGYRMTGHRGNTAVCSIRNQSTGSTDLYFMELVISQISQCSIKSCNRKDDRKVI